MTERPEMINIGYSLSALVEQSAQMQQIRKTDLRVGDHVVIRTLNSTYTLRVIESGLYLVSGGWFDRRGLSPVRISVAGCTWGGSAIKIDIVAACGLCLEFGNRVITSRIQKIFVLPKWSEN